MAIASHEGDQLLTSGGTPGNVPTSVRSRPYREGMRATSETPILAALITEFGERRRLAEDAAARLVRLLADVEALHEPNVGGECPTCGMPAPCPTLLLVQGEIDLGAACAVVRGQEVDVTSSHRNPNVPSLSEMLEQPTDGVDRFFDALLR